MNRLVNPIASLILRSPLHWFFSGLILLRYLAKPEWYPAYLAPFFKVFLKMS